MSSIVRVLTAVARGRSESAERRSTSSVSMPRRASSIAALMPAGPAPTIRTGISFSFELVISGNSIGQCVFYRTYCLTMDNMSSQ